MVEVYDFPTDSMREATQEEFDLYLSFYCMVMEHIRDKQDNDLIAAYERWRIGRKLPLGIDVQRAKRRAQYKRLA